MIRLLITIVTITSIQPAAIAADLNSKYIPPIQHCPAGSPTHLPNGSYWASCEGSYRVGLIVIQ